MPPPKLWVFSTAIAAVDTRYGPASGAISVARSRSTSSRPRSAVPGADGDAGEHRRRAELGARDVRVGVADQLLARAARAAAAELVAHRPGRARTAPASWPSSSATSRLERVDGRVLAVDVVADLGLGHRRAHRRRVGRVTVSRAQVDDRRLRRRQRPVASAAVGDQPLGDPERQLQRLLDVQPRVAGGLVAAAEVGVGELGGAAEALGDVVAGQLDVQAAGLGAQLGVHVEEAVDLVDDPVEVPGLDAVGGLVGVAVHRVALPDDQVAGRR